MASEEFNFRKEAQLEQFRSVMQVAAMALRSAMVVNGGAALALLTFMGNLQDKTGLPYFTCALKFYVAGVALAAFATGTSYLAQYRYLYELKSGPENRWGTYVTYVTISLVFSAYIVFVCGGWVASAGFG